MITLTTSQAAALAAPGCQYRMLVELDSALGTFRWAREHLRWGGLDFEGRLVTEPRISNRLGQNGLSLPLTMDIELSNVDGWCTQQRPDFAKNRALRVHEVVLEVDSIPLRTFAFTVTHGEQTGATTYRYYAEDGLSLARRIMVPSNVGLIDRAKWPTLPDNLQGVPLSILIGRKLLPLTLVDETGVDSSYGIFAACYGVASATGDVLQDLGNGRLSPVASYTLRQRVLGGNLPVTEVVVYSPIRDGGAVLPHYADLTNERISFFQNSPGPPLPHMVLAELLTNPHLGANQSSVMPPANENVTVASWNHATSFWTANCWQLHCALTAQRPLEQWLDAFQYEAAVRIRWRDKIYLQPVNSTNPVASLTTADVVAGTMRQRDVPIGNELSRHTVFFGDNVRDIAPVSFQFYDAGSGAVNEQGALLIGDRPTAYRAAQVWARYGAMSSRVYDCDVGVRHAALEEGDFVTLQHSFVGAYDQLVEITGIDRGGPVLHLTMREISNSGFAFDTGRLPKHSSPSRRLAYMRYDGTSFTVLANGNVTLPLSGVTGAPRSVYYHNMGATPDFARVNWVNQSQEWNRYFSTSLTMANNSVAQVYVRYLAVNSTPVELHNALAGGGVFLESFFED